MAPADLRMGQPSPVTSLSAKTLIERMCVVDSVDPSGSDPVPPFFDDLPVDDLLVVPALDQTSVLKSGHELIERRARLPLALFGQACTKLPAGALALHQEAEHEDLEVRDRW